jgi:hypothetical protein
MISTILTLVLNSFVQILYPSIYFSFMYFFFLQLTESIDTLPPFGPIGRHTVSGFSRFPANESLTRTGLHLSLWAKSAFDFSR